MVGGKKVDKTFVFELVNPKNTGGRLENLKYLPMHYTDLTTIIKVSENVKSEKATSWGRGKWRGVDKGGLENSEVYFVFEFSCDVDPDTLIERVIHEWRR